MYENSINNCNFLKFEIFVTDGHCNYSPRESQNLATPLDTFTRYLATHVGKSPLSNRHDLPLSLTILKQQDANIFMTICR